MHVLSAQAGRIDAGEEPVDLGQSPGDVLLLSAADNELSALAIAARDRASDTRIRLANLMQLRHPYSVDLYTEAMLSQAAPPKAVAVRLIGGEAYWPYGVERLRAATRALDIPFVIVPGEAQWDSALAAMGTVPTALTRRLWQLLVEGGPANCSQVLDLLADLASGSNANSARYEVTPLQRLGWCHPQTLAPTETAPAPGSVPIVFYASLLQSGTIAPIRAVSQALGKVGLKPAPLVVPSLKDAQARAFIAQALPALDPPAIINTTAFASSGPADADTGGPLAAVRAPVLQAILSGAALEAWDESPGGLPATDLIMHVAMPEIDGRLHGPAISFKRQGERDPLTEYAPVDYEPHQPGIDVLAARAARWARLREQPASQACVALVLAHYPTKMSRVGNGVGLDTPASICLFLGAMADASFAVGDAPRDSRALMTQLLDGPGTETLSLDAYQRFFKGLDPTVQRDVCARWGPPGADRTLHDGRFQLPLFRHGNTLIGIQPPRGYDVDPASSYHDPDLVPPHGTIAFYAFLQAHADAVVQFGKHGNLEWLPGKALALSDRCYPAALVGDLPVLYPFIVNDPGEGCQAKRRIGAAVVDHLTPPLTRAEGHGPYLELEALLDEYTQAEAADPRRARVLANDIVGFARETGLAADIGLSGGGTDDLIKLDTALCDLKELQIRDGLHIFGALPKPGHIADTLVAIARVPRGPERGDASFLRAIAADYGLECDPLSRELGTPYAGAKPQSLAELGDAPWRILGDTVERLEALALKLVMGDVPPPGPASAAVLDWIENDVRPKLMASPRCETDNLLSALRGRFVPPGPSGAPSRARPDVLPTGRNFYAVDVRAVPTPSAWTLGRKSAEALMARHFQEHGEWLQSLLLTCWGTANMRTGGDDIAQALALIGAQPKWEGGAGRVTGFEIMALSDLKRPRVDVTLRISGFFRDAFPQQIDLFDSACRAVAALDEPADMNPMAARVRADKRALLETGRSEADAARMAGFRVFGSMPGAYGAGLQALIDEGGWTHRSDFAAAFIAWGGFAYGAGRQGDAEPELLKGRLKGSQAVVQNQDNREHDLLDSDDYYQFEGGLAATIETLTGEAPASYHMDHSRPEAPHARTLQEEIGRVVRGRASNPKWIAGVMRHGYKGAFEMAATLDYLFAFAATTHAVTDHHFDALFDAYIADEQVRAFIEDANAPALTDMLTRFQDALDRGLWSPRRNTTPSQLATLLSPQTEAAK